MAFIIIKGKGVRGARSAIACAHVQRLALYRGHTAYGVVTLTASLEYFRAKKCRGILVSGGFVIAGNISSLSETVREEIG